MSKLEPYIDEDGEVRELDEHFFKHARRGRPPLPSSQRKKRVNLMLDPSVVEALKKRGVMSAEANRLLREALGLEP